MSQGLWYSKQFFEKKKLVYAPRLYVAHIDDNISSTIVL